MARFDINKQPASGGSKSFKEPTPGVQEARILRIIERGKQRPSQFYQDLAKKEGKKLFPKNEILVIFELADDKVEVDGKSLPMLSFYKLNEAGKKANGEHSKFTGLLAAAGIEQGGFEDLLGKPVTLTLTKGKNGGIFVTNVTGVSKRVQVPELVADSYFFDFNNPTKEVLDKLSDKQKDRIREAINFPGSKVEALLDGVQEEGSGDEIL